MKRTILLFLLGIVMNIMQVNASKLSVVDSQKQQIAKCKEDTSKVNQLINFADNCSRNSSEQTLKDALAYCNEAFVLSQKSKYKRGIRLCYQNFARLKYYLARYDEALADNGHAIELIKELKDTSKLIKLYINRSLILFAKSNYKESLRVCFEFVLPIIDTSPEKDILYPAVYMKISSSYNALNDYKKANEYLEKAIPYAIRQKNPEQLAGIYSNLGLNYQKLNEYKKAIEYLNKALLLTNESNIQILAFINGNLAYLYTELGKLDEAEKYMLLTISYQKKLPLSSEFVNNYNSLGNLYRKKGMPAKAIQFYNRGIEQALKFKYYKPLRDGYYNLHQIYSENKDYEKSNECLVKLMGINDSIYNTEQIKQITALEEKYKASEKEKQIEVLNKENEIKSIKMIRLRIIIFLVIVCFIALCVLAFFVNSRYKANIKLTNKLKELDELKSQFFANISHELRTPVSLILGPAGSLQKNITDKRSRKELEVILNNSQKLLVLINQLLDFSKIEKKAMLLKVQNANLTQSVHTILNSFSYLTQQSGVQIEFKPNEQEINGWFDIEKVDKILVNLISNAFKFTPKDGRITVTLNYHHHKRDLVVLSVADTGIGIAPDKQQHIFKRFYQIDGSVKRKYEGTGIGLALVKDLVELHHGTITVNSRLNEGSTFEVTLSLLKETYNSSEFMEDPKAMVEPSIILSKTLAEEANMHEHKYVQSQILIVEDNLEMQQYIARNLKSEYNIIVASNGQEGLVKARENTPALIVADVMMPVMDGNEFTRIIKNDSITSHIPVIMLTALAGHESRLHGLESEADDYITKPFAMDELLLRIKNLLLSRKKLREKFSKFISIEPSEIVTTSIDEQFLLKALQLIEENITDDEYGVDEFCNDMAMNRRNVYRKIKTLTNLSPSEFIRTIRLKRAARLISQKAASITEISSMVGFSSVSYFTKCFKAEYNVNPTEYTEIDATEQSSSL